MKNLKKPINLKSIARFSYGEALPVVFQNTTLMLSYFID